MRTLVAAAVVMMSLAAAPAVAQCVGGICVAPRVRAVVVAPVRCVGATVRHVRARHAVRVTRRAHRRAVRRAWLRGGCCG